MLGAHILDLRKLQRTVLLRLRERLAGDVRVNVDLERLVVLTDDERIADAVEVCTERGEVNVGIVLADDVNGVEGIGDLVRAEHVESAAFVCDNAGGDGRFGSGHFALQEGKHSIQNDYVALAACVHHARLFEDGV